MVRSNLNLLWDPTVSIGAEKCWANAVKVSDAWLEAENLQVGTLAIDADERLWMVVCPENFSRNLWLAVGHHDAIKRLVDAKVEEQAGKLKRLIYKLAKAMLDRDTHAELALEVEAELNEELSSGSFGEEIE